MKGNTARRRRAHGATVEAIGVEVGKRKEKVLRRAGTSDEEVVEN